MALELTTATTAQLSAINQALKIPILMVIYPNGNFELGANNSINFSFLGGQNRTGDTVDFAPLWNFTNIALNGPSLSKFLNADKLTSLEDSGTKIALLLGNNNFSAETLNQLFTDLPATSKTATINVGNNPGAATCDDSIATNKGYTVVS
jgi:hypothetical protein